jgi:hypothetical protein
MFSQYLKLLSPPNKSEVQRSRFMSSHTQDYTQRTLIIVQALPTI